MRWQVPPRPHPSADERSAPGAADERSALEALRTRFPALDHPEATPLPARFAAGEVVDAEGRAWAAADPVGPGDELWFHRELRAEHVPAAALRILHRDEHLLVLDKPHGMATMPRGAHVLASALVRLRRETGLTDLVPLHRLDRPTAGVLAFGIVPAERSAYQQLFARGEVEKTYDARVLPEPSAAVPRRPGQRQLLRDHLVKPRGELRTRVLGETPNAETELEVTEVEAGSGVLRVRLRPRTGRTHQLRVQLASRGAPILGENLYWPAERPRPGAPTWPEELPLQLLARTLAFTDPHTGQRRELTSAQELAGDRRTLER